MIRINLEFRKYFLCNELFLFIFRKSKNEIIPLCLLVSYLKQLIINKKNKYFLFILKQIIFKLSLNLKRN